jgi:hypothetical protein
MKIAKKLTAIGVLLALCILAAWSDYSWDARYLSAIGPDWVLCDRQTNAIDPIYVWQIFKQPAHRIELIQKSSIVEMAPSVYAYVHRWVDRGWTKRITEEDFLSFADCENGLTGTLRDGVDRTNPTLADVDWRKCDDNPYVRTEADKERLRRNFSTTCSLLKANHGQVSTIH